MLVGICARDTVELIPRQVCIVTAVDEIIRKRIAEINWCSGIGDAGDGGAHVFEEFVVVGRL